MYVWPRASEPAGPALGAEATVVAEDAGGVAVQRAAPARLGAPRAGDGHGGRRADVGLAVAGDERDERRDAVGAVVPGSTWSGASE